MHKKIKTKNLKNKNQKNKIFLQKKFRILEKMRMDVVQDSKENAALEEKLLKKRTFLKKSTKETLGNETAQVVIRIFETKYFGLKLFWLLGCSGLCFYLVAQTLMIYLGYPVYTTTTIVNEMPTVFPKITICNSVFATTEYAYQLIKQINDVYYPNISIFDQSQMSNLSYSDLQPLNKSASFHKLLWCKNILNPCMFKLWQE